MRGEAGRQATWKARLSGRKRVEQVWMRSGPSERSLLVKSLSSLRLPKRGWPENLGRRTGGAIAENTDEEPFSPFSGVDFPHSLYRTVSNKYRNVSNVYPQLYPSSICVFDTLRYTLDTKSRLWWGLSFVSSSGYRANFGDICIVYVSYMYRRSIEETVSSSVSFSVSCIF
jgi:hypothetical protein